MERKATMMSAMLAASAIASSAAAPPKVENGKIEPVPAVEVNARRGVGNFIAKLEAGRPVTVAYLGGSITEMSGWRNMTTDWLRGMWPEAKVTEVHAAIGGTGSELGVFRLGHDALSQDPDLLFVEFATNDSGEPAQNIWRNFDGIVQQTWRRNPKTDIVFAYTVTKAMMDDYGAGRMPNAASAMEYIADHYGIPSVCFGPRVAEEVRAGRLVMSLGEVPTAVPKETPDRDRLIDEELKKRGQTLFSKDGVHPALPGHEFYLKSVVALFEAMRGLPPADHAALVGKPFFDGSLAEAKMVPVDETMLVGEGWTKLGADDPEQKAFAMRGGQFWRADRPGAKLSFRFRGTKCGIYDLLAPKGANVRVTVDGKVTRPSCPRFDAWGWYSRLATLWVFDGADGEHDVEIEVLAQQPDRTLVKREDVNTPKYDGTWFQPCQIMVVGEVAAPACAGNDAVVDIDALCPPRAETAARFKEGAYPPAARPYREAAKMAYRYMVSLPAMTALVETGRPNQKYMHNAYVSKTHAAHVEAMLDWMRREPEMRETAMRFAAASAEFLLRELEPGDAPLAFWPPTYGRKPLAFDPEADGPFNKPDGRVGNEPAAAAKYRGEVMLVYPADVGIAFVDYWGETKDGRFLAAAAGIAETYLKTRRSDGSWPLKMKLATGETVGESALVPTRPLELFDRLFGATGEPRWRAAADDCFAWLEAHPLKDWNWDGQFEDIEPEKPYKNPTKYNAVDTMLYMLRRFPDDKERIGTCRKILEFCEKRFVVWEAPANHAAWPAPCVLEQYSCFTPIDASSAKMISAYLAMYRAEGRMEDLHKAKALADTVTRVQKPSGRIPTFWEGVNSGDSGLSAERFDWLNCMAATSAALLELADF